MKHFISLLLFSILFFDSLSINASNKADSIYANTMQKVLVQLDTAKTENTIQRCKNQFERISQMSPNQWIPLYYVAYCDIMSVYMNTKSANAAPLLNEANIYINKLRTFKDADRSEIETLSGFYYTALITLDPQVNGQKYFSEVIGSYTKAIKINPNNPRPICLLIFFNNQLPIFIQQKIDSKQEVEKARSLFAEETKNIDSPYWGAEYLNLIKLE